MKVIAPFAIATAVILGASGATAQKGPGQGPVATACADELAKFCAGKPHEGREARTCLEANKAKVSTACKAALDGTGGSKGKK